MLHLELFEISVGALALCPDTESFGIYQTSKFNLHILPIDFSRSEQFSWRVIQPAQSCYTVSVQCVC